MVPHLPCVGPSATKSRACNFSRLCHRPHHARVPSYNRRPSRCDACSPWGSRRHGLGSGREVRMTLCARCAFEIDDGARTCPLCGADCRGGNDGQDAHVDHTLLGIADALAGEEESDYSDSGRMPGARPEVGGASAWSPSSLASPGTLPSLPSRAFTSAGEGGVPRSGFASPSTVPAMPFPAFTEVERVRSAGVPSAVERVSAAAAHEASPSPSSSGREEVEQSTLFGIHLLDTSLEDEPNQPTPMGGSSGTLIGLGSPLRDFGGDGPINERAAHGGETPRVRAPSGGDGDWIDALSAELRDNVPHIGTPDLGAPDLGVPDLEPAAPQTPWPATIPGVRGPAARAAADDRGASGVETPHGQSAPDRAPVLAGILRKPGGSKRSSRAPLAREPLPPSAAPASAPVPADTQSSPGTSPTRDADSSSGVGRQFAERSAAERHAAAELHDEAIALADTINIPAPRMPIVAPRPSSTSSDVPAAATQLVEIASSDQAGPPTSHVDPGDSSAVRLSAGEHASTARVDTARPSTEPIHGDHHAPDEEAPGAAMDQVDPATIDGPAANTNAAGDPAPDSARESLSPRLRRVAIVVGLVVAFAFVSLLAYTVGRLSAG